MSCDRPGTIQKVMWISLGHDLRTTDHDHYESESFIFSHGPWSWPFGVTGTMQSTNEEATRGGCFGRWAFVKPQALRSGRASDALATQLPLVFGVLI
jgi:hypothetical protein